MYRHADMMRVATYVGERFSIFTTNPKKLGEFARDILASRTTFTLAQMSLRESLERVAKW